MGTCRSQPLRATSTISNLRSRAPRSQKKMYLPADNG